jgi:hypothetical protein
VLFAIVAGQLPFDDSPIQRLLQKIVSTEPAYPSFMSPALVDLLQKMLAKDPENRITLEGIKAHPWFSQSEYNVMVQVSRAEFESWETVDGMTAESAVNREVIEVMEAMGLDCTGLDQALLTQGIGDGAELVMLYRIFRRQKLTDAMRNLLRRVTHEVIAHQRSSGKVALPRMFSGNDKALPPLAGMASGAAMPLGRPRARPLGANPVTAGSGGRRLSRPLAMRRPGECLCTVPIASHEAS